MLKTYFPNFRKLVAPITRPGEERLLLVIHHLVVDLVSWQVLLEDLESLGWRWGFPCASCYFKDLQRGRFTV